MLIYKNKNIEIYYPENRAEEEELGFTQLDNSHYFCNYYDAEIIVLNTSSQWGFLIVGGYSDKEDKEWYTCYKRYGINGSFVEFDEVHEEINTVVGFEIVTYIHDQLSIILKKFDDGTMTPFLYRKLGVIYEVNSRLQSAIKCYLIAASLGDMYALYELAQLYCTPIKETYNLNEAIKCHEKAADRGCMQSRTWLGMYYCCEGDILKAIRYLESVKLIYDEFDGPSAVLSPFEIPIILELLYTELGDEEKISYYRAINEKYFEYEEEDYDYRCDEDYNFWKEGGGYGPFPFLKTWKRHLFETCTLCEFME